MINKILNYFGYYKNRKVIDDCFSVLKEELDILENERTKSINITASNIEAAKKSLELGDITKDEYGKSVSMYIQKDEENKVEVMISQYTLLQLQRKLKNKLYA